MAYQHEACQAVARRQASEAVFVGTIDTSEDNTAPRIIQRLARQLRCSIPVARTYSELNGLGPKEARA